MNSIKIPEDLFFNDYITFYLDKNYYNNKNSYLFSFGDINHNNKIFIRIKIQRN